MFITNRMVTRVHMDEAQGTSNDTLSWWEAYGRCANAIQARLAYYKDMDEPMLKKSLEALDMPNISYGQKAALLGLKAQVDAVPSKKQKGDYKNELDSGLKVAIADYKEAVKTQSQAGPFVIHSNVPYIAFDNWYRDQENCWRISFQFTDSEGGAALLYGDPSFLHEGISNWFTASLVSQATLIMQEDVSSMLHCLGSSRVVLPSGTHKEPDFCVQGVGSTCKIPPFVGEVAYANESLSALQGELVQWTLQGGARVAYGVKVSLEKDENGLLETELKLIFLERHESHQDFEQVLNFSPNKCSRAGDADYQVKLPLKVIFAGASEDERLLEGIVNFDLYKLQQVVLQLLKNSEVDFVWHPARQDVENDVSPLLGVRRDFLPS